MFQIAGKLPAKIKIISENRHRKAVTPSDHTPVKRPGIPATFTVAKTKMENGNNDLTGRCIPVRLTPTASFGRILSATRQTHEKPRRVYPSAEYLLQPACPFRDKISVYPGRRTNCLKFK